MNGHETEFYKRDVPQIRETLKKIGESLETIAHSLEVLAEIRIEDIARNHTELNDEGDEDLFKDEESHIPFPDIDDIQTVEDDINIPPYPGYTIADNGENLTDEEAIEWEEGFDEEKFDDDSEPEWGELPDEEISDNN